MKRKWLTIPTLAIALLVSAVSVGRAQDTVKDRKAYFPSRKQVALQGTEIGILLTDGQPILSTEGRSGPADQLVFSAGGNSYRWVYVPTQENPLITNLQVPVGAKGEKAIYAALNMANPKSVLPWAVTQSYSLVEVEVNGGRGSPANDSFVGTSFKALDGTKDYPLKVVDVIKLVKTKYAAYLAKQQKTIEQAMKDAAQKSLNGKEPTGPRETKELMYVTWLTESNTMRVHFKTTISDGAYTIVNNDGPNLPPFKLPPNKGKIVLPDGALVARIAPKNFAVKVGTTFGIELGQAFIVNKKGEIVGTEILPIEAFTQQLNAPFIRPGPVGPRPLPPVEKIEIK